MACRHTGSKRSFIRFVRLADLSVHIDISGKEPGRGAYLCAEADCFSLVRHSRRLDRALRTSVSEERWLDLADEFLKLCEQQPAVKRAKPQAALRATKQAELQTTLQTAPLATTQAAQHIEPQIDPREDHAREQD